MIGHPDRRRPFDVSRRIFVERMNRTLLDECFRVEGRNPWYVETTEIQRNPDRFLRHYNLTRTHQGYRLQGRTPAQARRSAGKTCRRTRRT